MKGQTQRKYKSAACREMYENFSKMFQQEGDCYDTILESIEEGYQHNQIDSGVSKMLLINILKDVTVDYYKDKIKVLNEKEYLTKI